MAKVVSLIVRILFSKTVCLRPHQSIGAFNIDSRGECEFKRRLRRWSVEALWPIINCLLSDLLHIPHSPCRGHCKYWPHCYWPRIETSAMGRYLDVRPDRRGLSRSVLLITDITGGVSVSVWYPWIQHSGTGRTWVLSDSSAPPCSYTAQKWWWLKLEERYLWHIGRVGAESGSLPIP